jgi:hypothetical protein
MKPTMTLITSNWHGQKTFRLIPITPDPVYSEGIYDPLSRVLVLFSRFTKQTVHLLPKLDDNGDMIRTKITRPNGKQYKEQRTTLETFVEYYVEDPQEIRNMIAKLADNADTFDVGKYLDVQTTNEIQPSVIQVTKEKKNEMNKQLKREKTSKEKAES